MLKQSALTKKTTAAFIAFALAATLAPAIAAPGQAHADEPTQPKAAFTLTAQAQPETANQDAFAQIAQSTVFDIAELSGGSSLATQSYGSTNPYNAPTIKFGRTITGTFQTDGSCVYYKFTASKESGVRYKFTVTITAVGGKKITSEEYKEYSSLNDSDTRVLEPGKVTYFYVGGVKLGRSIPVDYKFKIEEIPDKPAAPAVTSVKAGKKQLTVKYSASKYANRYQVKIGSKTYSNGKKLSKAVKHLKGGKTYKVKVRAQRCFKGKWYSGKWSSVKKVTVRR